MADAVTAAKKAVALYKRLGQKEQLKYIGAIKRERRREEAQMLHQRAGRVLEFERMKGLAAHRTELERQGRERIDLARDAARQRARDQGFKETMEQIKLLPNEHDRLTAAVQLNVKAGRQTEKWGQDALKLIEKDRKFTQKGEDEKRRAGLLTKFTAADPREKQAVIGEGIVSGLLDPEMAQEWRTIAARTAEAEREPTVAQARTRRMDELRRTGNMLKVWFRREITTASPEKTRAAGLTTGLLNDLAAGAMAAAQQRYGDRVTPAQIMRTAQDLLRENWDWIYTQANTVKTGYGPPRIPKGPAPALAPFKGRREEAPRQRLTREAEPGEGVPSGPPREPAEVDPNDPLGWR